MIRNVKGINTYKFYFQTPRYQLGDAPAAGEPGNCGNLYFENIEIGSVEPVDKLPEYLESDSVKGSIAGFELGANIESISLKLYLKIFIWKVRRRPLEKSRRFYLRKDKV